MRINPDAVIFCHEIGYSEKDLPDELLNEFLSAFNAGKVNPFMIERRVTLDSLSKEDLQYLACRWLYYQKSYEQARKLGYAPREDIVSVHNRVAILEVASFQEPGHEQESHFEFGERMRTLGQKYGFFQSGEQETYKSPDAMWHGLAQRIEGDCKIMMVGDDRGSEEHLITVEWYPHAFLNDENPRFPGTDRRKSYDEIKFLPEPAP